MKVFLAATDLSERSDRAVRRAMRLARQHHGRAHVLHVVDEALPGEMAELWRREAAAHLARAVASWGGDDSVLTQVEVGDPLTIIAGEARRLGADAVVFGVHRPRPFLDALRGTTVERMVRLIDRPALLVRETADHDYARVLAPVSFSAACAMALSTARRLAPEAEIAAVHAVYLPFAGLTHEHPGGQMDRELTAEAEAERSDWCARQGLPEDLCAVTPMTGSLGDVIEARIRSFKPDLIALGAHTRGRFAAHTLGSFAAGLVRNPPADLLLAHP